MKVSSSVAVSAVVVLGVIIVVIPILFVMANAFGPAPTAIIPQGAVRNGSVTYLDGDTEVIMPAYHFASSDFSSLNLTFHYAPTGKPFNASVIMSPADGNAEQIMAFPPVHVNASGIALVSVPKSDFILSGQLIPVSIGLAGGNGSVIYFGDQQIQRTISLGGGLSLWPAIEITIGAGVIISAIFIYIRLTSPSEHPKEELNP